MREAELYAPWIMLVGGSLAGGIALVCLLVVPRRIIPLVFLGFATMLLASMAGLFAVGTQANRLDISAVSALLGFLVFSLSYTVGALLLPRFLRVRSPGTPTASERSAGRSTVVLSACVEPERYSPRQFAATLAELDETGVPLPSWTARPMLFAAERARYRAAASTSPARDRSRAIAESLASRLADEPRVDAVETAWCTGTPSLSDVVGASIDRGDDSVLVLNLAVAESLRSDRAHASVDALRPADAGLSVTYAPPLWGSSEITQLIVDRTVAAMTDRERHTIGVCLVGHGQPAAWEADHPSWIEHETYFHQRIRAHLIDEGVPEEQVRLAWLDWTEPDVTASVRHLAALGCELVLVVPASMPVPTLGSIVDLQQAVRFARVMETATVVVLEPWGDDPVVVEELAKAVLKTLDERAR